MGPGRQDWDAGPLGLDRQHRPSAPPGSPSRLRETPVIATVLIWVMLAGALWALIRAPTRDRAWNALPVGLYAGVADGGGGSPAWRLRDRRDGSTGLARPVVIQPGGPSRWRTRHRRSALTPGCPKYQIFPVQADIRDLEGLAPARADLSHRRLGWAGWWASRVRRLNAATLPVFAQPWALVPRRFCGWPFTQARRLTACGDCRAPDLSAALDRPGPMTRPEIPCLHLLADQRRRHQRLGPQGSSEAIGGPRSRGPEGRGPWYGRPPALLEQSGSCGHCPFPTSIPP